MYQIVKDGVALALTEAPTYVRLLAATLEELSKETDR